MTAFEQLTYRGRIRRMRTLAQAAMTTYGLPDALFVLLRQAGNTLFRVHAPAPDTAGDLFEADQYLLRLHQPGYQQTDALQLELAWLAAMRREADLPVPEPVPTPDGRLLVTLSVPGIPGERNVSLLRWIKGRSVKSRYRPHHLRAQGRLMARLHTFSAQWQVPIGLTKRKFDWDGLFQNDVGSGMPNARAWDLLSPKRRDAFFFVASRVRELMDAWGQGPDVYGLIHGDLGVDANLLFWHGEPRAIDFDDSAFGYWIFDLAVALECCWGKPDFPRYRDALLEGYAEIRSLPQEQADAIELFIAACEVYWDLWAIGGTYLYPHLRKEFGDRIARTSQLVIRYTHRFGMANR